MPICSCFCPSIRPHFQRAHCGSLVSASRSSWFSDTITEQLCAVSRELLPLDSGHFFPLFFNFSFVFFHPPGLIQTVLTCGQGFSLQSTWSSSLPWHRAGCHGHMDHQGDGADSSQLTEVIHPSFWPEETGCSGLCKHLCLNPGQQG